MSQVLRGVAMPLALRCVPPVGGFHAAGAIDAGAQADAMQQQVVAALAAEHQRIADVRAAYARYCGMYRQPGFEANDYNAAGEYESLEIVAIRESWSREDLEGVILSIVAAHGLYPVGA